MKKIVVLILCLIVIMPLIHRGQAFVDKDESGVQKKSIANMGFNYTDKTIKAGEKWNSIGPFGGDVVDIAILPATPETMFAAAGTPYVSHDFGETWEILESLYELAMAPINTFEISSTGIIYAAGPYTYAKIFRSDDGGETWVQKSIPVNSSALDIAIDLADPNIIYAGLSSLLGAPSNKVIIKSDDQGDSWIAYDMTSVLVVGYSVVSLAIDPEDSQTILAIGNEGFSNALVVATFDGGASWEDRTGNLPTGKPLNHLTIAGQMVYIAGGQLFGSQIVGIYKSENYGQSWQNISTTFPIKVSNYILVDPTNTNKLYAASEGDGIYYTVNGGLTWNFNTSGAGNSGAARCLAFRPGNTNIIYAGFLSLGVCTSTDAAINWEFSNKGIANLLTNDIEANPVNPLQILVSFEAENSGGCYLTNDAGETWALVEGLPGTRFSQVGFGSDGAMYAWSNGPSSIAQEGLYKSTDGGTVWDNKGPNIGGLFETEIWGLNTSVSDPDRIFIGGNNFGVNGWASVVYRTINGGDEWENVYIGPDNNSFKSVFIDPNSSDQVVYAAFANQTDHAGFIKSVDAGVTWLASNNGIPSVSKFSGAIVCDPGNSDVLYGGVGGYGDLNSTIYKSENGGSTWNATSLNLGMWSRINDILVSPLDNNIIYAATAENGVYITTDGGLTWAATEPQIPATNVSHFSSAFVVNDTTYFCASTLSSSAFKTRIYNPVTGIDSEFDSGNSVSVLNNPARENCTFNLTIEKPGLVRIDVINISGQVVQQIENKKLDKGNYNYEIRLKEGVYFLKTEIDGKIKTEKILML
jgi:photosystem II stability/assembly factor-like uncharacterized protein